ncbi:5323_t:CDS:10 [Cetraspora pellucida]|uniref:5323_t:CDS:1 n=1 Tax=Cetraspora pellucida TaxID=1433469 RepID=A0A9N9HGK0_9GLOM|nr:5323_t:CDS:10 [Cetraspora pellucida]
MACAGVCKGWAKHATLINNCYPINSGETGPRSSELSYLLFYANSKPAKLTKCGVYLEKRVITDVKKRRKQDTEVSLQIIKALLEACHKNLNLFSKNIVKIITASLSTSDIDLVACATSVFITFCKYYDGSTLGVDTEFTEIYEGLIELLAKYATIKESDSNDERRCRFIGIHALQSAITSDALHSTSAKVQLQHIVPAILYNLIDDLNRLETLQNADHELVNSDSTGRLRRFSANITTISVEDNTNLAYNCLKQLFTMSNPSYINYSLGSVFNFLEDTAMWTQSNFIISLASTILSSLKQLEALPTGSSPTPKKVSLVKILSFILSGDTPLVGFSILEVLDCLLRLLLSSLKNSDGINDDDNITDSNESDLLICQQLTSCIGGLATHIYYANQISDIIEYIIQRLRINPEPIDQSQQGSSHSSIIEGYPLSELRKTLLKCLDIVVRTNKESEIRHSEITRCEVPVEVFHSSIDLCMDEDLGVRIAYAQVLARFLDNGNMPRELKEVDSTQLTYFNKPAIYFLNSLHVSLYQYAMLKNSQPADHVALLSLLRALLVRFRADQIIRGVPVVFKLQSEAKDESLESFAQQRALASVILLYFRDIASVLDIPKLHEYIDGVQAERMDKRQWSTYINAISSENNINDTNLLKSFEEEVLDENNCTLQPVDFWLDRQTIVSMLCQHKELIDIGGKDLEVRLMTEWKPEEGFESVKQEGYRIRSSRILENDRPRITITSFTTLEDSSGDLPKASIKVENLKDALANNDLSEHDTSVASDIESSNTFMGERKKKIKNDNKKSDINAFLHSLGTKNASSTTSLVNPPYRT